MRTPLPRLWRTVLRPTPALSEKEKDDWIGVIGRAIVQTSSMFTAEDGMEYDSDDSDDNGELLY